MHPYLPPGQPAVRFLLPHGLREQVDANTHHIRILNRRLIDLEASGKKCEKSQQETQSTASQYLKYFEERIKRLENLDGSTQRFENLERRMQQFEQFIKDIQERVAANKKPLDDVEDEAEAKAAGNGLEIEGIRREITAYKARLDTVVVLVSDLVDSTGEKPNRELVLRRSRRLKEKVVG